tara:strand:+ start:1183 stop:1683 length:501 start_codon:yes stop_codon:yes gene_type:complete
MKSFKIVFSSSLLLILLAAGAVVAEPPLPNLSFYQGEKLLESRPMTPREHTLYLKMRLALNPGQAALGAVDLADASLQMATDGIRVAVNALRENSDGEGDISISVDGDPEAMNYNIETITQYAERMAKAGEAFEKELSHNARKLKYDRIVIGEGSEAITISRDKKV